MEKEELEKRIDLFVLKKQRDPRLLIDIFNYLDENKKNKLFVISYKLQILLITRKARYVLQIENPYMDTKIYAIYRLPSLIRKMKTKDKKLIELAIVNDPYLKKFFKEDNGDEKNER